MKLFHNYEKIGTIHLLTQAIAFIVMTKGMALLFLQALSESPGWVIVSLWLILNYFVIALLINLLDVILSSSSRNTLLVTAIKILVIALVGGVVSFLFNLIYYRFHFFYIGKEFNLNDFRNNLWNFMTYIPPVIVLGELIRRNTGFIRRKIFNQKGI